MQKYSNGDDDDDDDADDDDDDADDDGAEDDNDDDEDDDIVDVEFLGGLSDGLSLAFALTRRSYISVCPFAAASSAAVKPSLPRTASSCGVAPASKSRARQSASPLLAHT